MGYSPHAQTAPTLGTNFDSDPRRRYSGSMQLQRSAPSNNSDAMDVSDGSRSPTPKPENIRTTLVSSNIDPALSGVTSPSEQSEGGDSAKDRAEEAWIENIRVIEALRNMIKERLERGEFEEGESEDVSMSGTAVTKKEESSSQGLYPTLKVEDD